ncbi:hypothetical protein A6A27_36215 [Micromonospora sp. CB01531]|nr:hypothetical protein [Micromonospora sp. CB01531]OKI48975.1 hypothetical protein A6A27_36215 [Micromonospora sp. CB01531]
MKSHRVWSGRRGRRRQPLVSRPESNAAPQYRAGSRGEKVAEAQAERVKGGENRQALLDEILTIVLGPGIGDEQIGSMLRTNIGMERMRAAWAERRERLPRDHGQLSMLDASMSCLRQFAPGVHAAVQFAGGPGTEQLLQAVPMLAGL